MKSGRVALLYIYNSSRKRKAGLTRQKRLVEDVIRHIGMMEQSHTWKNLRGGEKGNPEILYCTYDTRVLKLGNVEELRRNPLRYWISHSCGSIERVCRRKEKGIIFESIRFTSRTCIIFGNKIDKKMQASRKLSVRYIPERLNKCSVSNESCTRSHKN